MWYLQRCVAGCSVVVFTVRDILGWLLERLTNTSVLRSLRDTEAQKSELMQYVLCSSILRRSSGCFWYVSFYKEYQVSFWYVVMLCFRYVNFFRERQVSFWYVFFLCFRYVSFFKEYQLPFWYVFTTMFLVCHCSCNQNATFLVSQSYVFGMSFSLKIVGTFLVCLNDMFQVCFEKRHTQNIPESLTKYQRHTSYIPKTYRKIWCGNTRKKNN